MKKLTSVLFLAAVLTVVLSSTAIAAQTLKDILPNDLKKGLTPAEGTLLDMAKKGEFANFTTGYKEKNDPKKADSWGPERTIRAKLIRWLYTNKKAAELVHTHGIDIRGAKIEGNLDLQSVPIQYNLGLFGCALGYVNLIDASAWTLVFDGSVISGPKTDEPGFDATRLKTSGELSLRNVMATGEVRLTGADIGGNLACDGAEFNNPNGYALNCENASIEGTLHLGQKTGELNLINAKAGAFADYSTGWPAKGKLKIDGFEYGGLMGDATPKTAAERIEWLKRQPEKPFYPRPYLQFAMVFKDMGRESDSREVLIAMREGLRKSGQLGSGLWGFLREKWDFILEYTIGYGYETIWAVGYLFAFWLIGWILFGWAYQRKIMQCPKECREQTATQCSKECKWQTFSPRMYSLDVLLPIINFHQKEYFLPDPTKSWGKVIRGYFWFQIGVGWILATLVVASLTGLVH